MSPIEQSIKQKIEKVGVPLKDWDINIYRGVLTGFNDAFIISEDKKKEILSNCLDENERKRTAEIIRPILRGRDIKRYGYDWAGLWLIYIPWHFPLQFDKTIQGASKKAEEEFKKQYPAVYSHLLYYKKELSARNKSETGIRYEWYALQRWGANYWDDFNKPKVVYTPVNSEYRFSLIPERFIFNNSLFMITGEDIEIVCALCNSSLFQFYFFKILSSGNYQYGSGNFFENLPLIKSQDETKKEKLKTMVLEIQNSYTKPKAIEIDSMIFDLYNLTKEEIDCIESYFYKY